MARNFAEAKWAGSCNAAFLFREPEFRIRCHSLQIHCHDALHADFEPDFVVLGVLRDGLDVRPDLAL